MKKHISLILTGLLFAAVINAQNPDTLTNSTVIKMSKANLSEELIADMIKSSPVKFDLSPDAIKNLEDEGVTPAVIQTMKNTDVKSAEAEKPVPASGTKNNVTPAAASGQGDFEPSAYQPSSDTGTVFLEALNYVGPLTDLIKFNENKFTSLEIIIAEWNGKVNGYITDINKVKNQMLQVENELRSKKNADTKAFGDDIFNLKGKLEAYRKNYGQSKEIMIKGGEGIVKQIESMSSDAVRDLSKAYSEASQHVGSANTNPASGEMAVTLNYTNKEVSEESVSYIAYLNEMLAWYQNEIRALHGVINDWNPRVTKILSEDAQLKNQLEPIEQRIQELSSNSKQNKAEISTLKKQVSGIEKSRKMLADQMKDDAKSLAGNIKKMSQENQEAVKERFAEISENITYSFVERLSL